MVEWEGLFTPKPYGREAWLGPHLCPSVVLAKRLEKRKKRLGPPAATRHPAEEKDVVTSTRFLVTLRHLRRLGDAPTCKTHQENSERAKEREERGRRRRGKKGLTGRGVCSREWRGKGSSRALKKGRELRGRTPGTPLAKRGRPLWRHGRKWRLKRAGSGSTATQSLNADSRRRLINRAPPEAGVLSH